MADEQHAEDPDEPMAPEFEASTVGGHEAYKLGPVLGKGGMSVVYEVFDTTLERWVAMKLLNPDLAEDREAVARFLHEAKTLGQLDHPGVLPMYSAGWLPEYGFYYTMKRVRGQTLRQILDAMSELQRGRAREVGRLLDIFEKACQTIAYAHSQALVHRDLKPDNVMVDDYGVVLVMDWGLAKRLDGEQAVPDMLATQTGTRKGTPAYMSPEQAWGMPEFVDFGTDVFALGVILYEVLTGRRPFAAETCEELMQRILYHDPDPPHRAAAGRIDRALSAVCMKALQKDPDLRYADAEELAEDIRLYHAHQPVSAYRPGPLDRAAAWAAAHKCLAVAWGTVLLALVAFGAFTAFRGQLGRVRRDELAQREAMVDRMARQRAEQVHGAALTEAREIAATMGELDEQIGALGRQVAQPGPPRTDEAQALQARMAELAAARRVQGHALRDALGRIATARSYRLGGSPQPIDEAVLGQLRAAVLEELRAAYRQGDYYLVHALAWRHLHPSNGLGWTAAERTELRRLRDQAELRMRNLAGPGFEPPDWQALGLE